MSEEQPLSQKNCESPSLPFQVSSKSKRNTVPFSENFQATPEKASNTSFSSDNPLNFHTPSPLKKEYDRVASQKVSAKELPLRKNSSEFSQKSSAFAVLGIVIAYILTDIKKKPRSFKIGLLSIFLVVGFLVLMQSALQVSGLVFLKISENQIGDADLVLTPLSASNDSRLQEGAFTSNPLNSLRLLDGEFLERACEEVEELVGCAPRWVFFGDAMSKMNREKLRVYVLAVDSLKEKSIGLGRNLMAPALQGNESYVTFSTVQSLALRDQVALKIDVINTLVSQGFLSFGNETSSNLTSEQRVAEFKASLKQVLRDTYGFLSVDGSQTLNTSAVKTNAKELSDALKESGVSLDASLRDYPELERGFAEQLGVPVSSLENFEFSLRNLTEVLDSADSLPENTSFSANETVEAALDAVIEALNLSASFEIKENITSPNGKWPESLGNVLVFDYRYIPSIIADSIAEALRLSPNEIVSSLAPTQGVKDLIIEGVNAVNLKKLTVSENFVIKNRMSVYVDQNTIEEYFIKLTNKYFKAIGKEYPATASIPLAQAVQGVLIVKSFLDNIFTSAVFILIMLSVLLIYSLMLSNIDEKTYEFGMLRALGFQSDHLLLLLLIQGLIYAVPAMAFGFVFSFLVNGFVGFLVFDWAAEFTTYQLHYTAIIIGFLLGILMPLLSNILPIVRALSKTLRDSLDLYHRVVNVFAVRVMKLEKLGISFSQFINAFSLIIMGITTYYFAPLAFIKQDVALFLAIMNIVLIFLILGFTLLINLLQVPFEKLLLFLVLCPTKDRKLFELITKNMTAHRKRNAKTALMFTICLAFLIFSGAGFALQTNVIENSLRVSLGADLTVLDATNGLDEASLRGFLAAYHQQHPTNLQEYTFVTFPLDEMPAVSVPELSPLSGFPSRPCKLLGVEPNYLQTSFTKFYLPTEFDPSFAFPQLEDGQRDGFAGLFSLEGTEALSLEEDPRETLADTSKRPKSQSQGLNETILLVIPEGARSGLAIDTTTPGVLKFGERVYKVRVRNMARKVPGFGLSFSSYQTIVATVYAAVSMRQLQLLQQREWQRSAGVNTSAEIAEFFSQQPSNLSYGLTKQRLMVKFARELDYYERTELANGLRNYFRSDLTLLFDMTQLVETSQQAFYFINLFYVIVAMISIFLSFFLILVSFTSNVRENSWEFGVLRAIGLSKSQMTRLYMYEAGVLTACSGVLGSIVGIVVAITLVLQLLLFTELPFEFLFPVEIFCLTFGLGLVTAIGGSYFAVKEIREKSIANVTKGLL